MMKNVNRKAAETLKLLSLVTHQSSLIARSSLLIALVFFGGCERERRAFRVEPQSSSRVNAGQQTELQPGTQPGQSLSAVRVKKEYGENGYATAEGARLFIWYNCNGCHANGGGGMGPPLMDDKWIYGSEPEQIFQTIVGGRPNGMPSFRGKVPDYQVWQLVSYVRSMSRLVPKDVAPGRRDSLSAKEPEAMMEPKPPQPAQKPQ